MPNPFNGPTEVVTINGNLQVNDDGTGNYGKVLAGPLAVPVPVLVATTATNNPTGFPLQNATPTIISWTAPNDGQQHRAIVYLAQSVSSPETGGQVNVSTTLPDGTLSNIAGALGAGHGTGAFIGGSSGGYQLIVGAGKTVNITQATALTAGASVVWAEIWGS